MIWQQTPLGYLAQVLILGQPLIWMRLYDADIHVSEGFKSLFYICGVASLGVVGVVKASIGFYATTLVMQYIALTMLATYLYSQRYEVKQAVCLAFLTVFLNSYYWELPLHLTEYFMGSFYVAQLVQLWRLTPLLFFIPRGMIARDSLKPLLAGAVFSFVLMVYRSQRYRQPFQAITHPVNRLVCLAVLIYVITGRYQSED